MFLKTSEVAKLLNVSDRRIRQMVKEGKIKVFRLGPKSLRFRPSDIAEIVDVELPQLLDHIRRIREAP